MLDECKGDKFEELLFGLSSVVLQKVIEQKQQVRGTCLQTAQRAFEEEGVEANEGPFTALLLAQERSLRYSLNVREKTRGILSKFQTELRTKEKEVKAKRNDVERALQMSQEMLCSAGIDYKIMKKQVRHNSSSDELWLNYLISGDNNTGRDPIVEAPFEDAWEKLIQGNPLQRAEMPQNILVDLKRRLTHQQKRHQKWRQFQEQISKRNEELIPLKTPRKTVESALGRSSRTSTPVSRKLPGPPKTGNHGSVSPTKQFKSEGSRKRQEGYSQTLFEARNEDLGTVIDIKPPLYSNTPLGNRSNPLMKRATSVRDASSTKPAANTSKIRLSSHLRGTSESILRVVPGLNDVSDGAAFSALRSRREQRISGSGLHQTRRSQKAPLLSEEAVSDSDSLLDNPVDGHSQRSYSSKAASANCKTLADRTCETLGFSHRSSIQLSDTSQSVRDGRTSWSSNDVAETFSQDARVSCSEQLSLAERTRNSMAIQANSNCTTNASQKRVQRSPTKTKIKSRAGPAYPVNPFEAIEPSRQTSPVHNEIKLYRNSPSSMLHTSLEDPEGRRHLETPRRDLFSEDVDCASVFQTRSKMRRSPPASLSPTLDG